MKSSLATSGYFFPPPLRLTLYSAVNISVLAALGVAIAMSPPSNPRLLYVLLLTALCSSPILNLERINGGYFLLAVHLAVFYDYFGLKDLMSILTGQAPNNDDGILTESELVILAAAVAVTAGYHAGAKWLRIKKQITRPKEWPFRVVLAVGLTFWVIGTASLAYWQTFIITDRTNASLVKNLNNLGIWLATIFMLGQLVQPLGVLILAYAYAKYKRAYLFALIMLVVFIQIALGFVADIKGEAMQAGILVIITKTYVDGRLPKAWLLGGVLFVVLAFPVFQAQRVLVRGEQGVTPLQALENLATTVQKSLEAQEKVNEGVGGSAYRSQSFSERASLKPSVELIVARIGKDKPFELGATLTPIATAFIPKIIWPEKPSSAVGQDFNKEFSVSEVADTYISPSHVGEIYWNFGWPGILLIMPMIGFLLGVIGTRCSAYPGLSLTRLLVTVVTIYAFTIGSEGTIAVAYIVWLRSMVAIGVMHWMFARHTSYFGEHPARDALRASSGGDREPFPLLLR